MEFLKNLASAGDFMPHGYCYLWNTRLIWLHVISDVLIALAYLSIPITLIYFIRKRRDVPFNWMFVSFGIFILACGATHVMEVWNLWHGNYWVAGAVKALTAIASVPTAALLIQMVPQAIALPSPEALRREISERKRAEDALNRARLGLEKRTAELTRANSSLQESEKRFRLMANCAPVMIWMSGTDKQATYFNQPWLDFTGRSEADLQADLAGVVHPEDCQRCSEIYRRAFDQRQPFRKECRVRRLDGQYRWMLDIGVPRFHEDGSFAGYIGSCVDVTDRKEAEEALSSVNRRLIEAQDQERTRIARELHDDLGQRLTLLMIEMDQLSHNLTHPRKGRGLIAKLHKLASELASDIQSLSHRLHSSKLDLQGVTGAMRGFCKEFCKQQRVEVDFTSGELPSPVPRDISLCLYRVLQEALRNSVKHSGMRHYEANLWANQEEIHLTVKDFGKGFDLEMAAAGNGLGLISMRERLALVGGQLAIQSQPALGTTIHAWVPLEAAGRA
jgi:PAS domain S-box-containing protein